MSPKNRKGPESLTIMHDHDQASPSPLSLALVQRPGNGISSAASRPKIFARTHRVVRGSLVRSFYVHFSPVRLDLQVSSSLPPRVTASPRWFRIPKFRDKTVVSDSIFHFLLPDRTLGSYKNEFRPAFVDLYSAGDEASIFATQSKLCWTFPS